MSAAQPIHPSSWYGRGPAYLAAVGLALLTLLVRVAIGNRFDGSTMIVFTIPVILSAYWGGLGPGLLATAVSAFGAAYYLLPPLFSFEVLSTAQGWQEVMLLLSGTVISVICESLHRSRRRLTAHIAVIERAQTELQESIHERQRAEASLRESEELFSKVFRLSPDCVVISRLADRTVIRANENLCRLWGSTPENLIGKPSMDYVSWLSDEKRLAFMQTLQEHGECLNHETALRLADGRPMDFDVSSRLITFGGDTCVLTVMRDVTEQKRIEATTAQLAAIVESSDDAIIGRNLEGVVTSWNASAERLFGYSAQQMVGGPIRRLIPPERQEEEADVTNQIRRGENLQHFDTVRVCKEGGTIDITITASPIRDAAGTIDGVSIVARDITERKRVEAALRESEARFRSLFEYAPDGILIADPTGRYLDANAAMCRMIGYTRDELIALHSSDIVSAAEIPHIDSALSAIAAGADYHREWQFRRKDGSIFAAEVVATQMPDGNPMAMVRDITERRRTEAALYESEQKFRSMANSMPQLAWIAAADGSIVWYNQRWYEYTGTTPEQMEGWGWQSVHDPEVLPKVMERWRAAIESGQPLEMEFPLRGADGEFRSFLTRIHPMKDSDGRLVNWFGTNTDVETLKQAQLAVHESEERFRFLNDLVEATRTLADPAQIMAVMARMLGQHLRASRCAYADVEKDGERFTILHDYTDGCASTVGDYRLSLFGARAVATLYAGETLIVRNVEAELLPDDGADMFNAIGIKAIITCPLVKNGVLRAMMAVHQSTPRDWKPDEIAIVHDVVERCWATIERRTAEQEVHQLNVELEQRVVKRTAELEAANHELEAFSYSVSHDLRAPLRAVNGFAGMLMQEFGSQMPPDARRYLDRIRGGGEQMGLLIDDLLEFSRLSRQALSRRTVDTAQLVQRVLDELSPQHEGRHVDIHTGPMPDCWGDPALLKQVWINLLSNAIKYSRGREHAKIEIGCRSGNGEDSYFVNDNGTGFDMKYAPKLFGVFQRLHRADQFEGTGVGLAIVQRIVNRHGGRIWAESEEGRGATFQFTLATENRT